MSREMNGLQAAAKIARRFPCLIICRCTRNRISRKTFDLSTTLVQPVTIDATLNAIDGGG